MRRAGHTLPRVVMVSPTLTRGTLPEGTSALPLCALEAACAARPGTEGHPRRENMTFRTLHHVLVWGPAVAGVPATAGGSDQRASCTL